MPELTEAILIFYIAASFIVGVVLGFKITESQDHE